MHGKYRTKRGLDICGPPRTLHVVQLIFLALPFWKNRPQNPMFWKETRVEIQFYVANCHEMGHACSNR